MSEMKTATAGHAKLICTFGSTAMLDVQARMLRPA